MKKHFLIFLSVMINYNSAFSLPVIQWQKSLGGTGNDYCNSIQLTDDGGYVLAGASFSNDGDVTKNNGERDCWIVRLDHAGNVMWENSYGGTDHDEAKSIEQTSDGGFIVAGFSNSTDSDVTGNHGNFDCWILKLDSTGNVQWKKCYGGTDIDRAYSVQQQNDGGYIVAGYSNSADGDVTWNRGFQDYWIFKIDSAGIIQWQNTYGGTNTDEANSIRITSDGGYIVAGFSSSTNGNVTGHHSNFDYWIVKLDSVGIIQWQKSLGGTASDVAAFALQSADGNYVIAGHSSSDDGDVTGNLGGDDNWIVKLDSAGSILWQKSFGGTSDDLVSSMQSSGDGGFIVSGLSNSPDGDVTGNHGDYDYWTIKLDDNGNLQWQLSSGGTGIDGASCVQQTADGGYIVGGNSASNDGDVTGNHLSTDYWIVKLSSTVSIKEIINAQLNVEVFPNPFVNEVRISFELTSIENTTVQIIDIEGRLIKEFNPEEFNTGENILVWDGNDQFGKKVNNGLSFISIMVRNEYVFKRAIKFCN